MAGREVRREDSRPRRIGQGERDCEEGGLGDLGSRQRLERALEAEPADRKTGDRLGVSEIVRKEVRLVREELGAHADLLRTLPRIQERHSHCDLRGARYPRTASGLVETKCSSF